MSQIELERFLGRLITDADFRSRAAHSLKSTCCGEGIVLSSEEMSCLNHIDFPKFGQVADTLDDSIRRT